MVSWQVGSRTEETAYEFMHDLASRLSKREQLTMDGYNAYENAVNGAFRDEVVVSRVVCKLGKGLRLPIGVHMADDPEDYSLHAG